MPTKLQSQIPGSDENFFEKRPEQLAAIGLVGVQWTSVEEGLQMFFQQLMSYQMCVQIGWYQRDRPLLLANVGMILPVIESLRTRLEVISSVANSVLPPKMVKEWDSELVPILRRTGRLRNKISHGRWGYSEEYPNHVVLRDSREKTDTLYTTKDILFVAGEIKKADGKFGKFCLRCHHAYGDANYKDMPDNPPVR